MGCGEQEERKLGCKTEKGDDDGVGVMGEAEGGLIGGACVEGCSFKGNVQPSVKLQPIVLHIVPEALSKNSNKKRNHPLT